MQALSEANGGRTLNVGDTISIPDYDTGQDPRVTQEFMDYAAGVAPEAPADPTAPPAPEELMTGAEQDYRMGGELEAARWAAAELRAGAAVEQLQAEYEAAARQDAILTSIMPFDPQRTLNLYLDARPLMERDYERETTLRSLFPGHGTISGSPLAPPADSAVLSVSVQPTWVPLPTGNSEYIPGVNLSQILYSGTGLMPGPEAEAGDERYDALMAASHRGPAYVSAAAQSRQDWLLVQESIADNVRQAFPIVGLYTESMNQIRMADPTADMLTIAAAQELRGTPEAVAYINDLKSLLMMGPQGLNFSEKFFEKALTWQFIFGAETGIATPSMGVGGASSMYGFVPGRYNPLVPQEIRGELEEIHLEEEAYRREHFRDPFTRNFFDTDGMPDWGAILGRLDMDADLSFEGWMETIYKNSGVLGQGVTWMLHPDRYTSFINDVENEVLTLEEALYKYEDPAAEIVFNIFTDPINLLPGPIQSPLMKVLFPPMVVIEPALGWAAKTVVSRARVGVGRALATTAGEWLLDTTWINQWTKKSAHIMVTDGINDALGAAVKRFDDWSARTGGDARMFWMGIMNGDEEILEALMLGTRHRAQLEDLARMFSGAGLDFTDIELKPIQTISELFSEPSTVKSRQWQDYVKKMYGLDAMDTSTAEGAEAIAHLIDAALRNDPNVLLGTIAEAASVRTSRILGLNIHPRGSVRRFVSSTQQLLKEGWLAGSIRFNVANALSNFSNSAATGHFINPFDLGAPKRIQQIFESLADMPVPSEVLRTFWIDALDAESGKLLVRQIPVPGVGRPSEMYGIRDVWSKIGIDWDASGPNILKAIDKINLSTLMQKSMDISSAIENSARAQLFYQAYLQNWSSNKAVLIKKLAADADTPALALRALRGWVDNPAQLEEVFEQMVDGKVPSALLSSLIDEGADLNNPHLTDLVSELNKIQKDFAGDFGNPFFLEDVEAAISTAANNLERDYKVIMAQLQNIETLDEAMFRQMYETLGISKHVEMTHPDDLVVRRLRVMQEAEGAVEEAVPPPRAVRVIDDAALTEDFDFIQHVRQAVDDAGVTVSDDIDKMLSEVSYDKMHAQAVLDQLREEVPNIDEFLPTTLDLERRKLSTRFWDPSTPAEELEELRVRMVEIDRELRPVAPGAGRVARGDRSIVVSSEGVASAMDHDEALARLLGDRYDADDAWVGVSSLNFDGSAITLDAPLTEIDDIEYLRPLLDTYPPETPFISRDLETTLGELLGAEGVTAPTPEALRPQTLTDRRTGIQMGDDVTADDLNWTAVRGEGARYEPQATRGVYVEIDGEWQWVFNKNNINHYPIGTIATGVDEPVIAMYFTNYGGPGKTVMFGGGAAPHEALEALRKVGLAGDTDLNILGMTGDWSRGASLDEVIDTMAARAGLYPSEFPSADAERRLKIMMDYDIDIADAGQPNEAFRKVLQFEGGARDEMHFIVYNPETGTFGFGNSVFSGGKVPEHGTVFAAMGISRDEGIGLVYNPGRMIKDGYADGTVAIMKPLQFDELQDLAKKLTAAGADPKTVIVASVPDWPTGKFVGYIDEIATGIMDPGAPTIAEWAMWEDARKQYRANLVQETRDARKRALFDLELWGANIQDEFAAGIEEYAIHTEDVAAARTWFDNTKQEMAQGIEDAAYKSAEKVHHAFFDYAAKGNAENILRSYSPFTTWQLRNAMFWAQQFTQRPGMVAAAFNIWRGTEKERKEMNLTSRFKGTIGAPMPGGGYGAVDVRMAIPVFSQLQEPWEPIGYEDPDTWWQRAVKQMVDAGQWIGLRPWPWIEYGLQHAGVVPERDIMRGLLGPFHRVAEMLAVQAGVIKPWESLLGGHDPGMMNLYLYYINRELTFMEAEGLITHDELVEATDNPDSELYQAAYERAKNQGLITGALSLVIPTGIKYATPGEVVTRAEITYREEIDPFYRPGFDESYPYVKDYFNLFKTPEERATTYEIESIYETLDDRELSWEERDELYERLDELQDNVPGQGWVANSSLLIARVTGTIEDEAGAYYALRAVEPRAIDFEDKEGDIDWGQYNTALEQFKQMIPILSGDLGFEMTETRYHQWKSRYKSPADAAFEANKERINEGWAQRELLEPNLESFPFLSAVIDYVNNQYQADIVAGMPPDAAWVRASEEWKRVMVEGLPYDVEHELLGKYIDPISAEDLMPRVAEILALDFYENPELRAHIAYVLGEIGKLPGMFAADKDEPTEQAISGALNYYYELMPDERREIRKILGAPPDESFSGWIRSLEGDEAERVWYQVRYGSQLMVAVDWSALGTLQFGAVQETLYPMMDEMTEEERTDFDQVQRDWFMYNYNEKYLDKPGVWTDLMEQYYGDPRSAKSQFWGHLSNYSLKGAAFDDPTLGAFLNAVARGGLDFDDVQYDWASDYFVDHLDQLVDWEKTSEMHDNPEWVKESDAGRDRYSAQKVLSMEAKKAEYYLYNDWRPSKGVPSDREVWERENPEEWAELNRYLNERKAQRLAEPYYLYFYYEREFKKWFGDVDVTEEGVWENVVERGKKISAMWLKALDDLDKYNDPNQYGEWTEAMEVFIGPDPNEIEEEEEVPSGGGEGTTVPPAEPTQPPGLPPAPPAFPTPPPTPTTVSADVGGSGGFTVDMDDVAVQDMRNIGLSDSTIRAALFAVLSGRNVPNSILGRVVDELGAVGYAEDEGVALFHALVNAYVEARPLEPQMIRPNVHA